MQFRCLMSLGLMLFSSSLVHAASLDELDRGHRLLIEKGLQLQALVLDSASFDATTWKDSHFTTVNFWATPEVAALGNAPGIPWARWFGGGEVSSDVDLSATESAYAENLISMQAGDEQDLSNSAVRQKTIDTFNYWRTAYPGQIHMLSQMLKKLNTLPNYLDAIQPDLIAGGSYRMNNAEPMIGEPIRRGGSPQKMYKEMLALRSLCLSGHAGSNHKPIPYGIYTQSFYQADDDDYQLILSESQMRLQRMAAWAVGCTWICSFIYNNAMNAENRLLPIFFGLNGDWNTPSDRFYQIRQINYESKNLSPALVRLISSDVRMVSGRYSNPYCYESGAYRTCESPIPLADGMQAWAPGIDPYIKKITQTNLSAQNDGLPGDVLVGYFKPLHEAFDGSAYTDEIYFMIVNSMAFQEASSEETRQEIVVDFDFSDTSINSLQRLNRYSGGVETIPLESVGGGQYRLTLHYGGGEGDLFKFNTGAPFILADTPSTSSIDVRIDGAWNREVEEGGRLTLEAVVQGAEEPMSYQWYRETGAKMPAEIPGAESALLTLSPIGYGDAGAYWCVVTTQGEEKSISNVVNLSVVKAVPILGYAGWLTLVILLSTSGIYTCKRRNQLVI